MSYRLAKSLSKLRSQVDARVPLRSKKADGWIGDAKHASRKSDHNPWVREGNLGVVTAIDITHDPAGGLHARELAEALVASRDPRIKYVISEGQICSSKQQPWVWRKYTGSNGHFHHVHISVNASRDLYDNDRDWNLDAAENVARATFAEPSHEVLRRGSRGDSVMFIQKRLGLKPDGVFGPATESEVKAFQKQKGLTVDGIVGTDTWKKLL